MRRPRQSGRKSKRTLQDAVLEAFEQACDEDKLEIAEYLLRALEALARRHNDRRNLDLAYLDLADTLRRKR